MLAEIDAATAQTVAALPWMVDGIASLATPADAPSLSVTERIGRLGDVAQSWQLESLALDTLLSLAETDATTAQMFVAFPWVSDGVTGGRAASDRVLCLGC